MRSNLVCRRLRWQVEATGAVMMSLKKKIEKLMLLHETTRLLIRDLESRQLQLANRMYEIEQMIEGK